MTRKHSGRNVRQKQTPPSNWKRSHHPHPPVQRNLSLEVLGVMLSSSVLLIASQGLSYRSSSSVFQVPVAELLQVLNWSQKLVLKTAGGARAALDLLPREMKAGQGENIHESRSIKSSTVVHLSVNVLMRIQRLLEMNMDSDEWSNDVSRVGRTTGADRKILIRLGKSRTVNNLFRVVKGIRTAATDARSGFIMKALVSLHSLLSDEWVQMSTPSTVILYCIEPLEDIVKIAVSGSVEDLIKRMGNVGKAVSAQKNTAVHLQKLHESIILFCHIGFTADNPTMCKPQRQSLGELHLKVQAAIDSLLDYDHLAQYDQRFHSRGPEIANHHQESMVPVNHTRVSPVSTPPIDSGLTKRVSHSPSPYPVPLAHKPSHHQQQQEVCVASTHPSQQQQHSSKESLNRRKEQEIGPPDTGSVMHHNRRQRLQLDHSSEYPKASPSSYSGTMISCRQENEAACLGPPGAAQYGQPLMSHDGSDVQHSRNVNGGGSNSDIGKAPSHFPARLPGANGIILASDIPVYIEPKTTVGTQLETPSQQKIAKNDGPGGLEMLGTSGLAAFDPSSPLDDHSVNTDTVDESLIKNAVKIVRKPKFSSTVKMVEFLPWINEGPPLSAAQNQSVGNESDGGFGFDNDAVFTVPVRDDSELIHHFKYRNKTKALASGCRVCEEKSRPICNHCLNCVACYNIHKMPCSATRIAGVSSSDAGEAETFSKEEKGVSATLTNRMDRVIHKAFATKDFDPIFSLVRYQADLINFQRSTGETALHAAVFAGDTEAIKKILRLGGDPTLRDINGNDAAAMAFVSHHGTFPELAALVSKPVADRRSFL